MKKLALASAALGGAALVAFGASGTFAAFTDQANANVTPVKAGSLVLQAGETASVGMASEPLSPGESTHRTYLVTNKSLDTAGALTFNVSEMVSLEDGCTSGSEKTADADCYTQSGGELVGQTNAALATYAPNSSGECVAPSGTQYQDVGQLQYGPTQPFGVGTLGTGESRCVDFKLTFVDSAANNAAQGDSFRATLAFVIQQSTATSATGVGVVEDGPNSPVNQ